MKINRLQLILFLFIQLLFFSCNNSAKVSKTDSGEDLRIISLAPSITEEIINLGMKDNIVGATSYCSITKDNPDLIIGSAIAINEEKVMLLKPDVVFTTKLTNIKIINSLRQNNINVVVYNKASSLDSMSANFMLLAKTLGKEKEAKDIISGAKKTIDSLVQIIPDRKDTLGVFFQLGANPLVTVIKDTYLNELIEKCKAKNIFEDIDSYLVNRESVIVRDPDAIFITSMGVVGKTEKENWEKHNKMKAVKNGSIYIIDAKIASTPTVLNYTKTFEIMFKKLYS